MLIKVLLKLKGYLIYLPKIFKIKNSINLLVPHFIATISIILINTLLFLLLHPLDDYIYLVPAPSFY